MPEEIDSQEVGRAVIAQVREAITDTLKRLDQIEQAYVEARGQSSPPPTTPSTPSPPKSSREVPNPQPSQPTFPWKDKGGRVLFNIANTGSQGAYRIEFPTPLPRDDPAVIRFLIPKILEAEKGKHPGFSWRLDEKDSHITALCLEGVEDRGLLAIKKAVGWTVGKALDRGVEEAPRRGG